MLLDHFHPPLSDRSGWKGFHNQWAAVIAADLDERLPAGWTAAPEVEFEIEIDVGVVDEKAGAGPTDHVSFEPVAPELTIPFEFVREKVEVRIVNDSYAPRLMGAIELVSPANQDRMQTRGAFTSKCHAILSEGAGLVIVDIVTSCQFNLYVELLERLDAGVPHFDSPLYAASFQPAKHPVTDSGVVHIWEYSLSVEAPLPVVPLPLRVGPTLALDLQRTYLEACRQLRIPTMTAARP